jgi:hypothetical protein
MKNLVPVLIRLLKRYMMEHLKASSSRQCFCPICTEAHKVLKKIGGE